MNIFRLIKIYLLGILVLLQACSSVEKIKNPNSKEAIKKAPTTHKVPAQDGPPLEDIDVSLIPNAIPKPEPFSKYGNPPIYEVFGKRYRTMPTNTGYKAQGVASWYGKKFHGLRTSSGEPYDMYGMTAAHRSLPLPTYAKVKNLNNGKEVIVKINDRGPFVHNRLIDLSYAAAKKLGIYQTGTGKVQVTAIDMKAWQREQQQLLAKAKPATKKAIQVASSQIQPKNIPIKKSSVATASKTVLAKNKQLYIQLGAFNKKLSADQLATKATMLTEALSKANVHVLPQKLANKELYKVRVGPLKSKMEAQKLQKELISLAGSSKTTLIYE